MGVNSIGPIIAADPNTIEYSEIAPARCSFGTIVATIADLEGMSKANSVPVRLEITSTCHGSTRPLSISAPVPRVAIANISRVIRIILSLLNLSASTPPQIEKISTGPRFAVATRPRVTSDSVRVRINHIRPQTSDHIPMLENAAAIQNNLYSRYLNAE